MCSDSWYCCVQHGHVHWAHLRCKEGIEANPRYMPCEVTVGPSSCRFEPVSEKVEESEEGEEETAEGEKASVRDCEQTQALCRGGLTHGVKRKRAPSLTAAITGPRRRRHSSVSAVSTEESDDGAAKSQGTSAPNTSDRDLSLCSLFRRRPESDSEKRMRLQREFRKAEEECEAALHEGIRQRLAHEAAHRRAAREAAVRNARHGLEQKTGVPSPLAGAQQAVQAAWKLGDEDDDKKQEEEEDEG